MELKIDLVNFRNFKKRTFTIKPPTIIIGHNASGKTNIVESIFLLSTTNSFKKSRSEDFVLFNKGFAKITLNKKLKDGDELFELRIKKENSYKKEAYLNERQVGLSKLIGGIPTVVFAPESLHIIKGSPSLRRSFLNLVISQIDNSYLNNLLKYKQVKEERNKLLGLISEGRADIEELEFWNKELVRNGSYLIDRRFNFVNFLNKKVTKLYNHISREEHRIKIIYKTNFGELDQEYDEFNQIKSKYTQTLANSLRTDLKYATSTKGPHRDDIEILIDDSLIVCTGSQGEIRSMAFVIKLLEREYLKSEIKKEPLFLLDDPLSELDDFRAKYLLDKIKNEKVIITALEEELRGIEEYVKDFQIINLSEE